MFNHAGLSPLLNREWESFAGGLGASPEHQKLKWCVFGITRNPKSLPKHFYCIHFGPEASNSGYAEGCREQLRGSFWNQMQLLLQSQHWDIDAICMYFPGVHRICVGLVIQQAIGEESGTLDNL